MIHLLLSLFKRNQPKDEPDSEVAGTGLVLEGYTATHEERMIAAQQPCMACRWHRLANYTRTTHWGGPYTSLANMCYSPNLVKVIEHASAIAGYRKDIEPVECYDARKGENFLRCKYWEDKPNEEEKAAEAAQPSSEQPGGGQPEGADI